MRKRARPTTTLRPTSKRSTCPKWQLLLADDLDIPELAYEQDEPAPPAYDDLDADYGRAFAEPAVAEEPASQSQRDVTRTTRKILISIQISSHCIALATAFETNAYMVRRQANGHAAAHMSAADHGYDARSSEFDEV